MDKIKRRTKKWFLFGLAAILVIGSAVFIFRGGENKKKSSSPEKLLSQNLAKTGLEIDTDEDGLKDWEEELYGTGPKNPDSDGDGTKDGEEIAQNRDPLKKPPDETVVEAAPATKKDLAGSLYKKNLTQEFTDLVMTRYFSNRFSQDSFNVKDFAEQAVSELQAKQLFATVSERDLKIVKTADKEAVRKYLNATAEVVDKSFLNMRPDPLQLFASILQQGNFDQFYRFGGFVAKSESGIKALKSTPVPESWANEHIILLNHLLVIDTGLKAMRTTNDDLVFTLTTLKPYIASQEALINLLQKTKRRVVEEGLSFSREEPMAKILRIL